MVSADITIRPAVSGDYQGIRDLVHDADAYHVAHAPAISRTPAVPRYTREEHDEITTNEHCCVLVAEHDGHLVGFVEASECSSDLPDEVPGPWCGVHNFAVRPDYWRRGIGFALMCAVEGWAQRRGLDELRLFVFEFNTGASALYDRLGYTTYGRQMRKPLGAATYT